MTHTKLIAHCDKFDYILVNDKDIYTVKHGYILDNRGIPLGMRFECPLHLWDSLLSYSPHIVVKERA